MAKKDKKGKGQKLSYFLDHPQIKRNKSVGNGESPAPKPATIVGPRGTPITPGPNPDVKKPTSVKEFLGNFFK